MTYEASARSTQTVSAFFDSRTDAEEAIDDLVAAGFSRQSIRLVPGAEGGTTTTTSYESEHRGFWDSLADLFLPDEDRTTYAESLRRGGYLVTVSTSDADYERAIDILDREGTVDLDERATSWRSEGWTGGSYGTAGASGSGYGSTGSSYSSGTSGAGYDTGVSKGGAYVSSTSSDYASSGTGAYSSSQRGEEVIPVAEEEIRVGKREVSRGRVRVHSYVVETPVTEQVNLREERVHVERRPADRPLTGDERLFQDRTIEVEETAEEAVVSKDTRVREELVVGKDVEERTQTVSDTVRRTEVEIEDERGNRISGTSGRTSDIDRTR
jgi:uncharacterized protein (TIGR02271 family)